MDSARFEQVRPQLPLQARTPAHVMPIVVSDSFARTFFRGVDAVGAYPFRQRRPGADRRRCHRHVEPAADRPDEAMMYQPIYSGAGFIVYSRELLGCFGARDRGTCTNTLRISRLDVEARVLDALQTKLLRKDFFDEFCREFAKEMNRLRMEQRAGLSGAKRELSKIEARRKKLLDLMLDDVVPASEGKEEMLGLTARRDELQHHIKTAHEPPPLLHPSMADLYRTKIEELAATLQREDTRLEASETLRGLIDSIVLTPEEGQLRIELRGNLAAMLTVAQQTKRSPESGDLSMPVQMVAGAGFEPATFGL